MNTTHQTQLAKAVSAEIRAEMARQVPQITGIGLAGQIGVSQNYLAKRLRDEAPLNLDDIAAICDTIQLPFHTLMQRALKTMGQGD